MVSVRLPEQKYADSSKTAYETADGEHHETKGYDSVVLSMGYRNYNPLEEQVKAIVPDTYVIGDAIRARRALDATKEAYEVASQI